MHKSDVDIMQNFLVLHFNVVLDNSETIRINICCLRVGVNPIFTELLKLVSTVLINENLLELYKLNLK
jgi:hypothetical protein